MAQLKSLAAIVTSVITTDKNNQPLMKTRADGSKSPYALCQITFTEGNSIGKTVLAQRSLENRTGIVKESVVVGQKVFGTLTSVLTNRTTGAKMRMFEVTTTANATEADLDADFGDFVEESTPATDGVNIPLAS